jgi:putative inorganic carbon (HCO3(-)) transporter
VRTVASFVADHELIALGVALPVLLFPGVWSLLGVALIALTWVCRWLSRGHLSVRTGMDVPILFIMVMALVGLVPSVAPELSLNRLCLYFLGVSLFYGMANGLRTERQIHYAGIALVLLGLAVAVSSLLGTDWSIGTLIDVPAIYGRLPGPFIRGLPGSGVIEEYDLFNPRVVAGALAMILPVPLAYLVCGKGWKLRLLSGLTALVMATVLLLTQAPQGLLGLAAALLLIAVWRSRWFLPGLALGLLGLLLAWKSLAVGQTVGHSLSQGTLDALNFGLYSRLVNGAWGIAMVRDMPFTGAGLNTFPVLDSLYSGGGGHAPHAHNVLIQTAVDLGVPGLLGLLALLGTFAYTMLCAYRASRQPNQRALLIGICGAVLAWLTYGLLDSITLGHKPAMALWVMLGLAAATRLQVQQPGVSDASARRRVGRRRLLLALAALVVLLLVLGLRVRQTVGAFYQNLGVMEAHRALASADSPSEVEPHLAAATAFLSQATRWDPGNIRASHLLDWIDSLNGRVMSKRWPRDSANVERWRSVF